MRITANESTEATLTRLIRAMDNHHPATITYTKADGTETLRTIEVYDVTVSTAGDIVIKAMDRESGESRSWRLDRISAYTVHRTAYTVARPVDDAPAAPRTPGLAAAGRQLVLITTDATTVEARITWLADQLAA